MDFIVKLPKSKDPSTGVEYNLILLIMERLIKYAYFIPFKEVILAPELAHIIMRTVIANYRLLEEWITDRDTKFTSQFWKTLIEQLGIKNKLSTVYHPQTDGQTERLNQTVK